MKYVKKFFYLQHSFLYSVKKNKENFEFISTKQIDDDDDAESSHSDCLIIESDMTSSTITITSDNVSI